MLKNLMKLFFPKVCLACSTIITAKENKICLTCRHELPLTNHLLSIENEAFKKFYGRIPVVHCSSMLYYQKNNSVQSLIHNLKFKNHQEIGTLLGNWYVSDLKEIAVLKTVDFVIPVPIHKKRMKTRTYNQVTTFCESIAKGLNIELKTDLVTREIYAVSQSKKTLLNRNNVTENTFESHFSEHDYNKHFLLIDDVLTTGATLEACAKSILKIPGAKISMITIAMSQN